MGDTEKRLAALEGKIEAMEERRRRIVPKELEDNPEIMELQRDAIKSAVLGWKLSLAEADASDAAARFAEAKELASRKLTQATKAAEQRECAEIAAVIEYYERTGRSPEGYNVIDTECRKIF